MFEEMTYEAILDDMLNRVTSDVDKREGSIIYDALAPCAYQLARTYFSLNNFIDLVSGDTAVGEYLDRVVADYGITRKAATHAIRKVTTTEAVAIGTRWGLQDTSYVITEMISANAYKATCEQEGEIGNIYNGVLENIDNINGITATMTDIITSGYDKETDDNLRERFYRQIRMPGTSGSASDYIKWALEVANVGDAKVFPLWNGNGTVKVLVVDSNMAIDPTLPSVVAAHIEKLRPIGATVTVDSPGQKKISISAKVKLDGSKIMDKIQSDFISLIAAYFRDATFDVYTISYAKIGSLLLSVPGIADYLDLLVDNNKVNIALGEMEMPIVGEIKLMEAV